MGKPVGGDDYVMAGTGSPPLASVDSSSAIPVVAGAGGGGAAGQAAKVPAFLNKLFRCVRVFPTRKNARGGLIVDSNLNSMINDMTTDPLIYWSEDGKSFFSASPLLSLAFLWCERVADSLVQSRMHSSLARYSCPNSSSIGILRVL